MQDRTTGELYEIDEATFDEERSAFETKSREANCVLKKGEILDLMGGCFRVQSIGRREVVLRSMPGTRLEGKKA